MTGVEAMASVLVGVVAVPLLQVIKRYANLEGTPMIIISYAISFLLALIIALVMGGTSLQAIFANPLVVFSSSGVVMSTAQIVFRILKEKLAKKK